MSKAIAKKGGELATIDKDWAIVSTEEPVTDLLRDNMGGGDAPSPFDLPKISVPTGGSTTFLLENEIGGTVAADTIEGVILHTKMTRAWYRESYEDSGGGVPPDCLSEDGVRGVGIKADELQPPHLCEECPMSKYGSDRRGKGGQDCSAIRPIFLLRQDDILPVRVNAPAGSLKNARKFLVACTLGRVRYHQVIVRIGLEKKTQQDGGLEYAALTFQIVAKLDEESRAKIAAMRDVLSPMFASFKAADVAKDE